MKNILSIALIGCLSYSMLFSQKEKTYETKEISSPIVLDGHIVEEAWNQVKWEGGFIQTEPKNGSKPTFKTQFKILHDRQNLYVAIRAFDKHPDKIVIAQEPRDFFAGDYVEINIDSDFDREDAFSFMVTAAGIRGDEHIITSDNWFNDWNPSWQAQSKVDAKGWMAELKIPFSELEIYSKKEHWGIQVNRSIERLDEGSSWTRIPDEDKWVEYFGLLTGIDNIPVSRPLSLTESIPAQLLADDFKKLTNSLERAYPSLYRYHSKGFIHQAAKQTITTLNEEMTLVEYYKAISSFISLIGDGHMKVEFPDYFMGQYKKQLKRLPFKLKLTSQEAFVVENYSEHDLIGGARIISIDGKPTHKIVNELIDFIPSDGHNLTGKYHKISSDFDFYYSLISGFKNKVKIDFIPKGKGTIHSIEINLLADSELEQLTSAKQSNKPYSSFDFGMVDNIGILTLRTFNHAEGFQEFVNDSFKKLAESNAAGLILDLRGNGGGEETNAIHLYSYLTKEPFSYYDRYEVNVEPNKNIQQDATLLSYETLNFFAGIASIDEQNRRVLTNFESLAGRFIDPNKKQEPMKKNNYDGPIVVLMDGGSFSATSEICAIMKRDKRATFVGTETGGGFDGNTSGIYDPITLPNSRLKIKVPLIKYVSATENAEFLHGRGIMPDYPMTDFEISSETNLSNSLIDFALNYLNSEK